MFQMLRAASSVVSCYEEPQVRNVSGHNRTLLSGRTLTILFCFRSASRPLDDGMNFKCSFAPCIRQFRYASEVKRHEQTVHMKAQKPQLNQQQGMPQMMSFPNPQLSYPSPHVRPPYIAKPGPKTPSDAFTFVPSKFSA
jgi:hypothetical protein